MSDQFNSTEREILQNELKVRYYNLAVLKDREARYGLNVPLQVIHEISQEEERIAEIEQRLVSVTDEPSPAAQHFSKGTHAMLAGDFSEAKRYFKLTLHFDPYYPRADELLAEVEQHLTLREAKPTDFEILKLSWNWKAILAMILVALVSIGLIIAIFFWLVG